MRDVVVVGSGLARLSAASRARNHNVLVLESTDRVGGRIRSEARGDFHMNWRGYVFSGAPTSGTMALLGETGVAPVAVPGALTGLSMNGKPLLTGRVETYPFQIPMDMSSLWCGISVLGWATTSATAPPT